MSEYGRLWQRASDLRRKTCPRLGILDGRLTVEDARRHLREIEAIVSEWEFVEEKMKLVKEP